MLASTFFVRLGAVLAAITAMLAMAPSGLAHAEPSEASDAVSIPGPRRTIAVGAIEGGGGFGGDESWSVGDALSAMLSKALSDSGRFVVVERASLAEVLNEQQLQASRVAGGAPSRSRMIAAQFLVVGSVTEFGSAAKGGGLSVGGVRLGGGATGGAALSRQSGKVKIDLRLLDARTGQVVEAFTVSRNVSRTGVGLTGNQGGASAGANAFTRTPLGEASRQALDDAVARIVEALARRSWEGRVVDLDGGLVVVNAGAEAGLAAGDRMRIERIGRAFTDPDTGEVLSEQRNSLGEIVIQSTEARIARGAFTPAGDGATPQRGDLVVFAVEPR